MHTFFSGKYSIADHVWTLDTNEHHSEASTKKKTTNQMKADLWNESVPICAWSSVEVVNRKFHSSESRSSFDGHQKNNQILSAKQ